MVEISACTVGIVVCKKKKNQVCLVVAGSKIIRGAAYMKTVTTSQEHITGAQAHATRQTSQVHRHMPPDIHHRRLTGHEAAMCG